MLCMKRLTCVTEAHLIELVKYLGRIFFGENSQDVEEAVNYFRKNAP